MRVRSLRLPLARAIALWLGAWALPARGQAPEKRELSAPPPQFVFGSADCPDPKTVQRAVLRLIPAERQAVLARGVRVELEDLDDSYRVTVWKDGAPVVKNYSDPARECDGRARFAAVFTVLTLMPPELGEPLVDAESEPEPAPAATSPAVVAATPTALPAAHGGSVTPLARLELSALYAYAPAILEAPNMHSLGAELRAAIGRGALSGTLSIAYTTPAKFELAGVKGELSRVPLSVGVRFRHDFDSWSFAADLGLMLVSERVRATNLLTSETRRAANFGLRGGVQLARQFGPHLAPFVGSFIWLSPSPSELSTLPQGVIGNLPYVWLGGAAGVSFGL